MNELLANKLAPTKLDEVLGQTHLIGKDKILTNLIKNKKLVNMILYGKPGIGKNSIANAIINELNKPYRMLNAVINNKKDFDIVIEEAKMYNGLILVMDEIHRLNKDKQDLLLPRLESGLITLIGMTTANPYHKINPAIRSRCQIFELKELNDEVIMAGLIRATESSFLKNIDISRGELKTIVKLSSGDLRYAYNLLEMAYHSSLDKKITKEHLIQINNKPIFFYDNTGDGYYNVLSAFQKSIRGSDVNASIHYLARLIEAGDLDSICRRLGIIAYEDIGLANPNIGPKVLSAIEVAERSGLPEARIPLSVITIEMALSPKSNSAIIALDRASADIEQGNIGDVPKHLKPNSKDYKYPHNYPNNYIKQQYLPDKIINKDYYIPGNNKNENILKGIKEKLNKT